MGVIGCANWKPPPNLREALQKTESGPKQTHVTSKTRLVLEVEFVHLPVFSQGEDAIAESWQWVDETAIDPGVRSRLLTNGIRAGLLTDADRYRQQLQTESVSVDVVDAFLNQASIASEVASGQKLIPMRYGRRYELPVCNPTEGEHVMMLRLDGETIGRTLARAQYVIAMSAREVTNARQVQLNLRPEVQYGESKPTFVSSDTALRIDSRRESWSLEALDMNLTLREGDTVTLAPTHPIKGLAKHMLTSSGPDQQAQQTIILIRVSKIPTAVDQLN